LVALLTLEIPAVFACAICCDHHKLSILLHSILMGCAVFGVLAVTLFSAGLLAYAIAK